MNEKQLRVVGLLKAGKSPREIATETDIHYTTILKWKKKWEAEDDEAMISKMATHSVETLLEVKAESKLVDSEVVGAEVDKLIDGIIGLKELEPAFHKTMMTAIKQADVFLENEDISIKEWQLIMKSISEAYSAIFNKSGTVVNVANTNVTAGKEALNFFKASKGA